MRIYIIWGVILSFFLSLAAPVHSATIPSSSSKIIPLEEMYRKIGTMKIKDFQKLAGRKLSLKEKISFLILKYKINHPPKDTPSKGQTAMVFGIVGLVLLIAGLFLPYVILGSLIAAIIAIVTGSSAKRQDPSDNKAHTGKLLGWITLGLIGLLLILAVVLIAAIWG